MSFTQGQRREYQLPVLTVFTILWCVSVFLLINMQSDPTWAAVSRWGYTSDAAIFKGAVWGLITRAFVHVDPIHLLFNMYWLYILGGALERTLGPVKWIAFVLLSAFISSGIQTMSGASGIGFSGVGYAMFGFAWLTRERYPEIAKVTNQRLFNLFVGWGLLCIVLTYLKVMNIGNFAHASGLAVGALLGACVMNAKVRPLYFVGLTALAAIACASPFWCPISEVWVSQRAMDAHRHKDYKQAVELYRRALTLGGDPGWVWHNLAEIYGYQEDKLHYKEAVEELRTYDSEAANEVVETYGEPK